MTDTVGTYPCATGAMKDNLMAALTADLRGLRARLDAMDKASDVAHQDMVRVPTLLDRAITTAQAVLEEKLKAILSVTTEKFARVDGIFTANALALSAALQAAKEAVAEQQRSNTTAITKSETAVSDQIKQMQINFEVGLRGLNEKIDDIKSRMDKGEGGTAGAGLARTEGRLDSGLTVTVFQACLTAVAVLVALFEVLVRR